MRILKGGILFPVVFLYAFSHIVTAGTNPDSREASPFEKAVTAIAEKYIHLPYGYGKNPEMDGAADNSHLIHEIHKQAARIIGLGIRDYMPMKDMLKHMHRVDESEVKNGDLIVLKDGFSALLYKVDSKNVRHFIYASEVRKRILSFSDNDSTYKGYWGKNKVGFYRFDEDFFESMDM